MIRLPFIQTNQQKSLNLDFQLPQHNKSLPVLFFRTSNHQREMCVIRIKHISLVQKQEKKTLYFRLA